MSNGCAGTTRWYKVSSCFSARAQALDASVFHYRDSTDLEADAIVERRDGAWAAFEVKLGQGAVDGAAETLLRLAARVDPERHGGPAVLGGAVQRHCRTSPV